MMVTIKETLQPSFTVERLDTGLVVTYDDRLTMYELDVSAHLLLTVDEARHFLDMIGERRSA